MADPDSAKLRARSDAADGALLEAWREGDAEAGEALFIRHYRALARFFRNKINAEQVGDLIQATLIHSVESRDRIENPDRFRPYLFSIAYRVLCKHLRDRNRRQPDVDFDAISIAALDPSPSSFVGQAREQRLLLEGLRTLPVNFQVVLELHYWEDLTTQEIARVLDTPPGTVRSRLQRARGALEAAMASISRSPQLLESTLTRLEDWAADCGRQLGRGQSGF